MAWTFERTKNGYGAMWRSATIKPGRDTDLANEAVKNIIGMESQYRSAFEGAGMPWYFGAAIHYREANNDLRGCMVNGEKIVGTDRRTTLVPAGRGPYDSFKESVQDAAALKGWRSISPWSIERFLYQAEIWNGLGYVSKGVNAPFVWAGTNHEELGLYVRDHVFDPDTEDTRLGVAAVIKRLMEVRPDIAAEIASETRPVGPLDPNVNLPEPPPLRPIPVGGQVDVGNQLQLLIQQLVQQLLAMLIPALLNALTGRPAALPPPAPPPPVTPPPGSSTSTNLMGGGALGISSIIASLLGVGPEITSTAGMVMPLVGMLAGFLGVPAPVVKIGGNLLGGFMDWIRRPKT